MLFFSFFMYIIYILFGNWNFMYIYYIAIIYRVDIWYTSTFYCVNVQSNLAIRNCLGTLKLFLNAKCSLFIWSKWQIGHRKWFLNTNKFLNKTFLIAKFDCTLNYLWSLVFSKNHSFKVDCLILTLFLAPNLSSVAQIEWKKHPYIFFLLSVQK